MLFTAQHPLPNSVEFARVTKGEVSMKDEREFDVIVFGATGFTGRLVAAYLLEQYGTGEDLRWAVAGRNPDKLAKVLDEMGGAGARVPRLEADSGSESDMAALAGRTRVICTTVGPYGKYGTELLRACVENGTDYCDLTAEIPWMVEMMETFQERAVQTGARIIHACGFGSCISVPVLRCPSSDPSGSCWSIPTRRCPR